MIIYEYAVAVYWYFLSDTQKKKLKRKNWMIQRAKKLKSEGEVAAIVFNLALAREYFVADRGAFPL